MIQTSMGTLITLVGRNKSLINVNEKNSRMSHYPASYPNTGANHRSASAIVIPLRLA